jgi:hypothetical protein
MSRKIAYMLIVIIALLIEGILPISCSCGGGEDDPSWQKHDEERIERIERGNKEIEEREKNFGILINRAELRADGAPEEYINMMYPLPGSTSKSNINPADLPAQVKEIIEDGGDGSTGNSGGDCGY